MPMTQESVKKRASQRKKKDKFASEVQQSLSALGSGMNKTSDGRERLDFVLAVTAAHMQVAIESSSDPAAVAQHLQMKAAELYLEVTQQPVAGSA